MDMWLAPSIKSISKLFGGFISNLHHPGHPIPTFLTAPAPTPTPYRIAAALRYQPPDFIGKYIL
jgi:hypothetical protein